MSDSSAIVLATQHGKEGLIAPVFNEVLAWRIDGVAIDTDQFGTFSGDTPRPDSPEKTALVKARAGMAHAGAARGLASEGSIGPDPRMPLITTDQELIVYVDDDLGFTLSQWHHSADIVAYRHTVSADTSFEEVTRLADLPRHAVIITNDGDQVVWVRKGLRTIDEVMAAVEQCQQDTGRAAVISTDYRAMVCPSRQAVITECARLLAQRLATPCPQCASPGWGVVDVLTGVPCEGCGTNVAEARRGDVWGCVLCAHRVATITTNSVEPSRCPRCNP